MGKKLFQSQKIREDFYFSKIKSLSWVENLNKLFTDLGGKFKFPAQDSDLEYLFILEKWDHPVSSDLKPPLELSECPVMIETDVMKQNL